VFRSPMPRKFLSVGLNFFGSRLSGGSSRAYAPMKTKVVEAEDSASSHTQRSLSKFPGLADLVRTSCCFNSMQCNTLQYKDGTCRYGSCVNVAPNFGHRPSKFPPTDFPRLAVVPPSSASFGRCLRG